MAAAHGFGVREAPHFARHCPRAQFCCVGGLGSPGLKNQGLRRKSLGRDAYL